MLTRQWPRIVALLGLAAMIIVSTWAMDAADSVGGKPEDKAMTATAKIPPLDEQAAKVKTKTATFALG